VSRPGREDPHQREWNLVSVIVPDSNMFVISTASFSYSFILVPDSRMLLMLAASFSFRLIPVSKMLLATFRFNFRLVTDSISDWLQIQFQISSRFSFS
jgi:hypothetical protein